VDRLSRSDPQQREGAGAKKAWYVGLILDQKDVFQLGDCCGHKSDKALHATNTDGLSEGLQAIDRAGTTTNRMAENVRFHLAIWTDRVL